MRKNLFVVFGYVIFSLISLFCVEGIHILFRWKHADRSIVYSVVQKLNYSESKVGRSDLPLASREEIESLLPDMVEAGVGMGNVPYKELMTEKAAVNTKGPDGCQSPKANLQKTTTYLRSTDYDLFDPPSMFFDRGAALSEQLSQFVRKYAVRQANFTTNKLFERVTVPYTELTTKALIAGDSLAAGAMIDDSETLSSRLQQSNSTMQYINLGVNGVNAGDIICRLASAAKNYRGQISAIVYVYSEKDFDPSKPFGKSEEVIDWLKKFATDEHISQVTIVFSPYIYNIIPNLTRFPGSRGAEHKTFQPETEALKQQTIDAGFKYVSIGEIANEEISERKNDFAAFAMFVDHAHLSDYGISKLVKKLRN